MLRMTSAAEAFYAAEQTAQPGEAVIVPPAVVVRDEQGMPLAGVMVRFLVTAGGGSVEQAMAVTDAGGLASSGQWTLGTQPGPNEVNAVVSTLPAVRFRVAAELPTFRVSVRYLHTAPLRYQQLVSNAVRRWESLITDDLADYALSVPAGTCFDSQPSLNETIDDVLIYVELVSLDGPGGYLGEAGPCYLRSADLLPVMGHLKLDVDDLQQMEDQNLLADLVLHEVGHILGVGTLWQAKRLLHGPGTTDPRVGGENALTAYRALGGAEADVPAENSGGAWTRDVHWRESVFTNELMTGYIDSGPNPLSALTVGTLRDLGYRTKAEGASAYVLGHKPQTSGNQINLHDREQVVLPKFTVNPLGRRDAIIR